MPVVVQNLEDVPIEDEKAASRAFGEACCERRSWLKTEIRRKTSTILSPPSALFCDRSDSKTSVVSA